MNILGEAKSYLEAKGIDTSMMTEEEIIQKYYELLAEEEISEEEVPEDEFGKFEDIEDIDKPELTEEPMAEQVEEFTIDAFIFQNQSIVESLTEEQKAFVDELIKFIR